MGVCDNSAYQSEGIYIFFGCFEDVLLDINIVLTFWKGITANSFMLCATHMTEVPSRKRGVRETSPK